MSFFEKIFGPVNKLKESTEQKEITNKIDDLYESIAKGVEELNAKVNSVKELKIKLKNLPPPPPPEKPKETSSGEKTDKVPIPEPVLLPPMAAPPKPATSSSGESGRGSGEKPDALPPPPPPPPAFGAPPIAKPNTDLSPLPMPGAAEVIPRDSPDSLDYDGGKKRKSRAKAKRTISKNKNNSKKRTRKNKNKDKEATPESTNTEAAAL
jgi:hypothetical protein